MTSTNVNAPPAGWVSPAVMDVLTSVKSLSVVKETGGPSPRRAVEITVLAGTRMSVS